MGQSARLCHDALKNSGLPVYGVDLTRLLRQVEDVPDFAFADGTGLTGAGTVILHVNSPTVPLAMWRLGRRLIAGKRIVGCWAWELPDVPADWRHGIGFVHEIWVPSEFTAAAIRPIAGGRAVAIIPYSVALRPMSKLRAPKAGGVFTVITIFNMASSFARKNPCAAIRAFRLAFSDDPGIRLIVKTANVLTYPAGLAAIRDAIGSAANITVMDETLSSAELENLLVGSDALISLHRSEGFGLTLAEAMLGGVPVVATGWSGNADFLSAETGMPVPYQLVPAVDPQGSYHHPDMVWAEADVAAAAVALRQLRDDPVLRARLTATAASFAGIAWSEQHYVQTVRQQLGL